MKLKLNYFLSIIIILSLSSCKSCKLQLSQSTLPPDVKTFSVQTFENNAANSNPQLAQILTEKLRDKFISDLGLELVNQQADLAFTGAIVEYQITSSAATQDIITTDNRLNISASATLKTANHPELDFKKAFSQFQNYGSQNISAVEDELIDEITDLIVQDIFNQTANQW